MQGNPIMFSDAKGDTVQIEYQTEEGETKTLEYTQGMEYEGDNEFVQKTVNTLNEISEEDNGEKVLSELVGSDNVFSIKNKQSSGGKNFLGFSKGNKGGGTIKAKTLMDLGKINSVGKLGHELFHAYQYEQGQDPNNIDSEVGAGLFGKSLIKGYGMFGSGQDPAPQKKYMKAFNALLFSSDEFNIKKFQQAVHNFKLGSSKNIRTEKHPQGPYTQFPIENFKNPQISNFFPLVK